MSFGAIYCRHNTWSTTLSEDLCKQILYEIDNSVDYSKFNLAKMEIDFDIENPLELPSYINKREINRFKKLYSNDSFEFINMILWGFLQTNPKTKAKLDLLDQIIGMMKAPDNSNLKSNIDTLIQKKSHVKSFDSFIAHMLKDHGIDFDEYKASREGKLKTFRKQQLSGHKVSYTSLDYELPILKKFSPPIYIEIYPDMEFTVISKHIQSNIQSKNSEFIKQLPSKNTARILHDALIIYKYLQHTNNVYEKAIRYFNFHILQTFDLLVAPKQYISLKDRAAGVKEPTCKIVTTSDLELTKNKISERKKVTFEIEALLKLPKTGL